ncbi:hypothetical protein V8C34DRAFT_305159 [Trichoderma compactum]|uniref:Uncharacterized protein n=1 Tax=Trichoderma aggressivum f. europaeum TaxID=173218 RepID=A0AAE1I9U4_9HYPO|nr:hypothetical protein Triagg1_8571 [Trichoderma aggressivum f. europaeum]
MFGSYSSYSSVSTMSTAIDISPSNLRTRDASCAFPSWPRRESLSEFDREERATSFLSDDDLLLSDPFDSDSHSIASSSASSSPIMMMQSPPRLTDAEVLEMQREKLALQRECMRQIMLEKERRKQASKKKSRSASAKKSPKSKLASMTPISE